MRFRITMDQLGDYTNQVSQRKVSLTVHPGRTDNVQKDENISKTPAPDVLSGAQSIQSHGHLKDLIKMNTRSSNRRANVELDSPIFSVKPKE